VSVACLMCGEPKTEGGSTCRRCRSITFVCTRCGREVVSDLDTCPRCDRKRRLLCARCQSLRDPEVAECPRCKAKEIYCDGCYRMVDVGSRDCNSCAGASP
jgi:hypothetical protein